MQAPSPTGVDRTRQLRDRELKAGQSTPSWDARLLSNKPFQSQGLVDQKFSEGGDTQLQSSRFQQVSPTWQRQKPHSKQLKWKGGIYWSQNRKAHGWMNLEGTSGAGHLNAVVTNLSPFLLSALFFSVWASPLGSLSPGGGTMVQLLGPIFCQPCKSHRNRKPLSHWFQLTSQG